jgi:hypothetical protein
MEPCCASPLLFVTSETKCNAIATQCNIKSKFRTRVTVCPGPRPPKPQFCETKPAHPPPTGPCNTMQHARPTRHRRAIPPQTLCFLGALGVTFAPWRETNATQCNIKSKFRTRVTVRPGPKRTQIHPRPSQPCNTMQHTRPTRHRRAVLFKPFVFLALSAVPLRLGAKPSATNATMPSPAPYYNGLRQVPQ